VSSVIPSDLPEGYPTSKATGDPLHFGFLYEDGTLTFGTDVYPIIGAQQDRVEKILDKIIEDAAASGSSE